MKKQHALISFSIIMIIVSGCTNVTPSITATNTLMATNTKEPTFTYTSLPTITSTTTPVPPFIILSADSFILNHIWMPSTINLEDINLALGEPSRIDKLQAGTYYVYDEVGLACRTDINSDTITDIDINVGGMEFSFTPAILFTERILVNEREFPYTMTIQEIMSLFPEITQEKVGDIAVGMYTLVTGMYTIRMTADRDTGKITTMGIGIKPSDIVPSPIKTEENVPGEECVFGGGHLYPPVEYITGTISGSHCGDDWFFTLSKGIQISMTMKTTSGNLQPGFSVFTTANDDCENCADMTFLGNSINTTTQASLSMTLPFTGDYYLRVTRVDQSSNGTYEFSVTY
jgi:hypothetical protein